MVQQSGPDPPFKQQSGKAESGAPLEQSGLGVVVVVVVGGGGGGGGLVVLFTIKKTTKLIRFKQDYSFDIQISKTINLRGP